VQGAERIEVLDCSGPPAFSLNPDVAGALLRDSSDAGLRDALTTHGVVFFSVLEPQIVLMPPMLSVDEGLPSILDTLDKMERRGWFSAKRLHTGELLLGSVPGRHQALGYVAKKFTEERRMIVHNSYPHPDQPCFMCVGRRAPVISLNDSTGAQDDRSVRKAERMAARASNATPPANGGPALASVQALARRDLYVAPARLPGSSEGAAVLPPKLKPFLYEILLTIAIVAAAGETLGLTPVILSDDFHKFFHQFALAPSQRWTSHPLVPDPAPRRRRPTRVSSKPSPRRSWPC
jgi:hypothetical protein